MRIAVHFPADHPESGGVEGVAAYRLGRIEDGVHNAPVGHEPVELGVFIERLVAQAQEDHPGATVVVERLVDNGDGTSTWIPADDFDPEVHTPVGAGMTVQRDVSAPIRSRKGDD